MREGGVPGPWGLGTSGQCRLSNRGPVGSGGTWHIHSTVRTQRRARDSPRLQVGQVGVKVTSFSNDLVTFKRNSNYWIKSERMPGDRCRSCHTVPIS